MKISVSEELKKNAKWRLGDVIANSSLEYFYMIVKNNKGKFVMLGLNENEWGSYSTENDRIWYGPDNTIDDLQVETTYDGENFQKVNARLDIEKPVIDEEEEKKMMIETGITSEEWNIGDVIVSEKKQGIALIVKDNDGLYCAMDIDALDKSVTTYSTEEQAVYYCGCKGYYSNIKLMQSYFATEGWHKVKAVLKVDSNIELGGDKND